LYLTVAGIVVFGTAHARRGADRDLVGFLVAGLIGVLTFPMFAVPFVFGALALCAGRSRREIARMAVGLAGVGAVALLVYVDALGGILQSSQDFQNHRSLDPLPWSSVWRWPFDFVGSICSQAAAALPGVSGAELK